MAKQLEYSIIVNDDPETMLGRLACTID